MREQIEILWAEAREQFRRKFILRWIAANMLGWPAGFGAGALLAAVTGLGGSPVGLALAGACAGAVIGFAQQATLRGMVDFPVRRWWLLSAAGGAAGGLLAFFVGLVFAGLSLLVGSWTLVFMAVGGTLGATVGMAQFALLRDQTPLAGWWVAANIAGGMLGGALAVLLTIPPVPLLCSAGPLAFGALTGAALIRMMRWE